MKGYFYSCSLWNWNYCVYCKYKWLKKETENLIKDCFLIHLSYSGQFSWGSCGLLQFWNASNTFMLQIVIFDSKLVYKHIFTHQSFGDSECLYSAVLIGSILFLSICDFQEGPPGGLYFFKNPFLCFWPYTLIVIQWYEHSLLVWYLLTTVKMAGVNRLSLRPTSHSGPATISVNTASAEYRLTAA